MKLNSILTVVKFLLDVHSVPGIKRNTLSEQPLVDRVGLTHLFYSNLLKTFRFIPDTHCMPLRLKANLDM